MNNNLKILCIGSIGVDISVWPVDVMPNEGQLSIAKKILQGVGGCAANVSTVIAKLGYQVRIIGKVGNDSFGKFAMSALCNDGVDTSNIIIDSIESTGTTIVLINEKGNRSFIYSPGANSLICPTDIFIPDDPCIKILHISDVFLLPLIDGTPSCDLLKSAKRKGIITSIDTSWDPFSRWDNLLRDYFPQLDFFFTSFEEAKNITHLTDEEEMVDALLNKGVMNVIIKMGEKGSIIGTSNKGILRIPSNKIIPVIDTTGAGDTYVGTFLCGILEDLAIDKCAYLATEVAGESIKYIGATTGVKKEQFIKAFSDIHQHI